MVLGEVHDNPVHHQHQARAVAAIEPQALVFEMLTEAQAANVAPELRDDPEALEEALGWGESGWPGFAMYYPVFAAAPAAPVFGGALPRDAARMAMADGAAAALGPDAAVYGLDRPLSEAELAARVAEQGAAHCDALPGEMLPGMVEAQRLRDAALARAVLRALDEAGAPVALITGNGHARTDHGVPAYLAQARPELEVLSIGQLEEAPGEAPPYDLWLVTAAVERADPCEAFQ